MQRDSKLGIHMKERLQKIMIKQFETHLIFTVVETIL